MSDILDIRDIIEEYETLEDEYNCAQEDYDTAKAEYDEDPENFTNEPVFEDYMDVEDQDNMDRLKELLDKLEGYGGDEQWNGSWYPVALINESYFTEYAIDLLKDIGELPSDIPWYIVIDEEATADNIKSDYSAVEFEGETYYYR